MIMTNSESNWYLPIISSVVPSGKLESSELGVEPISPVQIAGWQAQPLSYRWPVKEKLQNHLAMQYSQINLSSSPDHNFRHKSRD